MESGLSATIDTMTRTAVKTYTTRAICLKRMDYREADQIVTFYSRDLGKVDAIAKGTKREKSKLAGACQLLHVSDLQLVRGKSLEILSQYEPVLSFSTLSTDILKLAYASLFAELLNILATEDDGDSQVTFDALVHALSMLDVAKDQEGTLSVGVSFQVELLELAGLKPEFDRCVVSGVQLDLDARPYYAFSVHQGGAIHPSMIHEEGLGPTVNVSSTTLKALCSPQSTNWSKVDVLKVHRFLQYDYSSKLERDIRAYEFVLELL